MPKIRLSESYVRLSFLESLGLPEAVNRICKFDGLRCVDPCSHFCGSYPFPVDPVDPHNPVLEREPVIILPCSRCLVNV